MTGPTGDRDHKRSASPHVVLVGLMGSGKSSVGRLVADALDHAFVDVDTAIEAATGKSVRELWEEGGEDAYRPLERQVVVDALAGPSPVVLAAPGGVIDDADLVERMSEPSVFVVWLRAEVDTLAARIEADEDRRPLVGQNPKPVLEQQAASRSDCYRALAYLVIDVDDQAPEASADRIVAAVAPPEGRD